MFLWVCLTETCQVVKELCSVTGFSVQPPPEMKKIYPVCILMLKYFNTDEYDPNKNTQERVRSIGNTILTFPPLRLGVNPTTYSRVTERNVMNRIFN